MDIIDSGGIVFGRHTFDPARCELHTAGRAAVPLGQRAGRLLDALIGAHGRVLSRDDLLRSVWPGQDVPDGNLRVQIAALRRALAEDRELIGTVAGRGYLFAGHAERRAGARPALPAPVPCIGRGELVDAVLARCAQVRFVTLAGTAGIGKTALALAAAHQHGHAVWVELQAVDGPGVGRAVAAALGLDAAASSAPSALAARLRDVPLLLVLDNCEHVADACSALVETLLRQCPGLAVLATSRQPLLAHGETVMRVPALALPAPGEADAARLGASGAVELFVRRAGADAGFAPDAAALACIGTICRRLEGLPLAIELAAARVPALGLAQVAAGLADTLDLLLAGAGAGPARAPYCPLRPPPRHRTLRAALDWSHVLLPPVAQLALRRIAAFASWFTLDEAAAALHPCLSPYDTIDALASLATHSLLVVGHDVRPARYRLLATTRAYALALSHC
ncbi:putative ATPase [Pseudoduganella flava]|nr:winged helix-turn-helix domain-containing protein [Pseudoduganella flava]TWI49876.1 putative ATPase [Pseudoduganella flava]